MIQFTSWGEIMNNNMTTDEIRARIEELEQIIWYETEGYALETSPFDDSLARESRDLSKIYQELSELQNMLNDRIQNAK